MAENVHLRNGTEVSMDSLDTAEKLQPVLDDLQSQVDTLEAASRIMGAQYAGKHGNKIPRSFYQTKYLLVIRRRELQAIKSKLASIRSIGKHDRQRTFDQYFVRVAELRLPSDVFESIRVDAKRMLAESLRQEEQP